MLRVVPSQVVDFIDVCFPDAHHNAQNVRIHVAERGYVSGLLEMVDNIPGDLIRLNTQQTTEFVSSVAAIRNGIKIWEGGDHTLQILSLRAYEDLNPVSLIRRNLCTCPDESPAAGTAELQFIAEQGLRESIRLDISSAFSGIAEREWKTATVMAGSAVEALLLWALHEKTKLVERAQAVQTLMAAGTLTKKPGADLNRWDLAHFIEVTAHLAIIDPDTATQARLAQNFRNLIHPGRVIRLSQTCDKATALSAVAAVEHVSRDLAQRYP